MRQIYKPFLLVFTLMNNLNIYLTLDKHVYIHV